MSDLRQQISAALTAFAERPLAEASISLLGVLGYSSERRLLLKPNRVAGFLESFDTDRLFRKDKALADAWLSVDFLFQLTDLEVRAANPQGELLFDSSIGVDNRLIQSYLFLAIELRAKHYTRTDLATITREINRLFKMPAMLVFKIGNTITLSVIHRRLHKRASDKDVLEKVTLIKDIRIAQPHRAHLEILHDLSLGALYEKHGFGNFVTLHAAWQKTLDSSELNRRFYSDIANWFFWARKHTRFPQPEDVTDSAAYQSECLIRLITRLVFCWFLKEKRLLPDELFNATAMQRLLRDFLPARSDGESSAYYRAILQNLFFATLNTEMDLPGHPPNRRFSRQSYDDHMIHSVFRHEKTILAREEFLRLMREIPFLNGGLFECLDERDGKREVRIDGFSDKPKNCPVVPDFLFFGVPRKEDLRQSYGDVQEIRYSQVSVTPLIEILDRYKFTVTENTPIEEEVALDPELLGLVFENLLASYNPETGATARKQTGSFYTPRAVVDFMVNEALVARLTTRLTESCPKAKKIDERFRQLLAYTNEPHPFKPDEVSTLIEIIDTLKIIDPACGSGAFPMGMLHKLVFILGKLDPGNADWKARQLAKAREIPDPNVRDQAVAAVELAFERNEADYGRKLYLIENCLYGVDIQPIACQIAKLRFFISLVVNQTVHDNLPNRGILALPNLETKIVAANTLLGLHKGSQMMLANAAIAKLQTELRQVRHDHFTARRYADKKALREKDRRLRAELAALLKADDVMPGPDADKIAQWNPYNPYKTADFLDTEWMYWLKNDFDICIGNPPYVRQEDIKELKAAFKDDYGYFGYSGTADLYVFFYERGLDLIRIGGVLCYISSNKYFRAGYGERLRHLLNHTCRIRMLIDFGDAPVFNAIAYPSIILAEKARETREKDQLPNPPRKITATTAASATTADVQVLTWEPGPPISDFPEVFAASSFAIPQRNLTHDGWRLESPAISRLLEKLRGAGTPLGEYVQGRFYYGIKTGLNEAFVVDRATRDQLIAAHPSSAEILKPFLRGRDVKRWRVQFAEQYLIKIESSENRKHPWSGKPLKEAEKLFAKTYPAIHERFQTREMRAALIAREDQGKYFWELRSCVYWDSFEGSKLIYPDIYEHQSFAWDTKGFLAANTCYFIPTAEEWLTGLLNSQVVEWFYSKLSNKVRGGYMRSFSGYMRQVPIPTASQNQQALIVAGIRRIASIKQANPDALAADPEAQIDGIVAQLYGLTEEEFNTIVTEVNAPDPVRIGAMNAYRDVARGLIK